LVFSKFFLNGLPPGSSLLDGIDAETNVKRFLEPSIEPGPFTSRQDAETLIVALELLVLFDHD